MSVKCCVTVQFLESFVSSVGIMVNKLIVLHLFGKFICIGGYEILLIFRYLISYYYSSLIKNWTNWYFYARLSLFSQQKYFLHNSRSALLSWITNLFLSIKDLYHFLAAIVLIISVANWYHVCCKNLSLWTSKNHYGH